MPSMGTTTTMALNISIAINTLSMAARGLVKKYRGVGGGPEQRGGGS